MKIFLLSLLIGCVIPAVLNIFKPIEEPINALFLTVAITLFVYVYVSLWQTNKKRRKNK